MWQSVRTLSIKKDPECPHDFGAPAVHHHRMFCCRWCSYTACADCATRLYAALLATADAPTSTSTEAHASVDLAAEEQAQDAALEEARGAVRDGVACPMCRKSHGEWEYLPMPFFRWRCEGPSPGWRFKDNAVSRANARDMSRHEVSVYQHLVKKDAEKARDDNPPFYVASFDGAVTDRTEAESAVRATQPRVSQALSAASPTTHPSSSRALTTRRTRRGTVLIPVGFDESSSSDDSDDSDDKSNSGSADGDGARSGGAAKPPGGTTAGSRSPPNDSAASPLPRVASSAIQQSRELLQIAEPDWHEGTRGNACIVGKTFVFSVGNTGKRVGLTWLGLSESVSSQRPGNAVHKMWTAVPLSGFFCPTTDTYRAAVAKGHTLPAMMRFSFDTRSIVASYLRRGIAPPRWLVLRIADPIFWKNQPDLDDLDAPPIAPRLLRPLLRVHLMYPLELLAVPRPLAAAAPWTPWNLPVAVAHDAVTLLQAGRCVAVTGIGCKRHLLERIAECAELRRFALHELDAWRLGGCPSSTAQGASVNVTVSRAGEAAVVKAISRIQAVAAQHLSEVGDVPWGPETAVTEVGCGSQPNPEPHGIVSGAVSGGGMTPSGGGGVGDVLASGQEDAEAHEGTSDATPARSMSIGPTQMPAPSAALAGPHWAAKVLSTPAARMKLPQELQNTPGGSARQGKITDMFELAGPDMPRSGTFGMECAASREARGIVHRALQGASRVRRVATDVDRMLLPHGSIDDPRRVSRSSELRHLLVLHGADALDPVVLSRLADYYANNRTHLSILTSFDSPTFPPNCTRLESFGFAVLRADTLVPHARDEAASEGLQAQAEAFQAEAARHRFAAAAGPAAGGGGGARSLRVTNLPLRDTVMRALLSNPEGLRRVLGHMIARQSELGDDVFMSVNALLDHLAASCDIMLPTARLRSMITELASNRIVAYEPSLHAMRVLQLPLVREVLEEITTTAAATARGAGAPAVAAGGHSGQRAG